MIPMSNTPKNGGPAFPSAGIETATDSRIYQRDGMTLRDWCAGQALAGCLINYTTTKFGFGEDDVAKCAYNYADAMLAERAKGGAS